MSKPAEGVLKLDHEFRVYVPKEDELTDGQKSRRNEMQDFVKLIKRHNAGMLGQPWRRK